MNGLTLRIPLPTKPQTQKKPTKIEQALLERYEEQLKKLRSTLPLLLQASLSAVDPYGEVPSTARLYWEDLLLDALEGDRNASDSGQAIRMRLYESETEDGTHLCLSLQMK